MSRPQLPPIMVPCVGSGTVSPHYLCPMCGIPVPEMGEPLPDHDRTDVLAMLARGDFG